MNDSGKPHHLFLWYKPQDDRAREWRLTPARFRFLGYLVTLGAVTLLIAAVFYAGLIKRALEGNLLKAENQRLRAEISRVKIIERDLLELQQFGSQVQRSLTEGADLGRILEANEAARDREPIDNMNEGSWLPLSANRTVNLQQGGWSNLPLRFSNTEGEVPRLWPVEGFITRGFEPADIDPAQSHIGIDIAVPRGTPIRASAGGIVLVADWTPRLGHMVIVGHGGGILTVYGHNEIILVQPQDSVKAGSILALSGNSGISTAPHLHFETWIGGKVVDPLSILYLPESVISGDKDIAGDKTPAYE